MILKEERNFGCKGNIKKKNIRIHVFNRYPGKTFTKYAFVSEHSKHFFFNFYKKSAFLIEWGFAPPP